MTVMYADDEPTLVRFTVHGDPVPQGSKKWVGRMVDDNAKSLRPWRQEIVLAALQVPLSPKPILGPVEVKLLFRLRRLTSHYGTGRNADKLKHSSPDFQAARPDIDKLCRSALDAFVTAALIRDDGQVAVLVAEKRYADTPGLVVEIRPLA